MAGNPSRVCPLCGHQDDLRPPTRIPEGGWQFVCDAHTPAHVFETTADDAVHAYPEGLASDLGLYDDLPRCLEPGAPWVEYGILEHRYGIAHPDEYAELVRTYGHVVIEPKRYSASSFLAGVLGRLAARDELALRFGPATGRWSYNRTISYWALPPAPPADESLTWAAFAEGEGIDPATWPVITSRPERR